MMQIQFFQELKLMIDSHCHLNFDSLKDNIDNVINNAKKNNITSLLSINTDPNEFDSHLNLISKYKSIYISYGLHPESVSETNFISKDLIIKKCENEKIIGIGETGLDFYHSDKFKSLQYESFEEHIEASIATNLPLIIHQRNSENEIINVLKKYQKKNPLKVVFHCFTGSEYLKNFCFDNEFYFSFSGIVTFKNANTLRENIKDIPLKFILIETDSPFLSPVPFRGKQNEPANVLYVAKYLSEFYEISLNKFVTQTDKNFYKLFSKAIRYNEISI